MHNVSLDVYKRQFLELAKTENLEATAVADVTDTNRLTMEWNGKKIVDISREFLNSNGAETVSYTHLDVYKRQYHR